MVRAVVHAYELGLVRPGTSPHNPRVSAVAVPSRLSSFVGRRRELADLRRLLGHTRLLTILGPGGAGKTRLATELAGQHPDLYPDGVVFVDLSGVRDAGMVGDALARAFDITLQGGPPIAALLRQLGRRRLLLIFDNCEPVLEEAALTASQVLAGSPGVTILATSRERLNIEGEVCWMIPPLSLPPAAGAPREGDSDALSLFVDRARRVRPEFFLGTTNYDDVVAICRHLDGMPLAIELAAARMIAMTPSDLRPRLEQSLSLLTDGPRDAAHRQQTLRATLDSSYNVLSETERLLLQRMAVFAGERDAAAIEQICGFGTLAPPLLPVILGRLAEKSMVQVRQAGDVMVYRMLATVREYALGKLADSGEEKTMRDRHLAHYRALSLAAFEARRVRGALPEHQRLWREMDDVRAALEWCRIDTAAEVEMLGWLGWVWMMYAPDEGRARIGALLPRAAAEVPVAAWYQAAGVYLAISGRSGDHTQDALYMDRVIAHAIAAGDLDLRGSFQLGLAFVAERRDGDLRAARDALIAAIHMLERAGNGPELALGLQSLASVERQLGNLEAARDWITRGIEHAVRVEDPYNTVGAYFHLGWLELDAADLQAAVRAFAAGLELVDDSDLLSVAHQVEGVATALAASDAATAASMFAAAARLRDGLESPRRPPWVDTVEPAVARAREALGSRGWQRALAAGEDLDPTRLRELVRQAAAGRAAIADGGLSRREMEIARLVAAGMTNRAIAEKLFLSERTVESHVEHIRTKLGFNSRAQVAAWVTERQL